MNTTKKMKKIQYLELWEKQMSDDVSVASNETLVITSTDEEQEPVANMQDLSPKHIFKTISIEYFFHWNIFSVLSYIDWNIF